MKPSNQSHVPSHSLSAAAGDPQGSRHTTVEEEEEGSTIIANPPEPRKPEAEASARSVSTRVGVLVEREVGKLTAASRMLGGEEEFKECEEEDLCDEEPASDPVALDSPRENRRGRRDEPEEEIPLFDRKEIMAWTLLGNGAFSEVYQIWGFNLARAEETNYEINPVQEEARQRVKDTAMDDFQRCSYVLKHLRNDLLGPDKSRFVHAASDLVMEALFLSKLNHPNIIKLRGTSRGIESFGDGDNDGFFLILDRLDCTLSDKINHWARSSRCRQKVYSRNLYDYKDKIDIALQLARGLDYLHDRDIVFRDLKPDNIGIQGRTVKIFDFGLCRELPEECPVENKVFHMSGVGTRRYMAPEIFLTQHYNLKVDVYSFAIVLHCMLSLVRPFEKYNAQLHTLLVCKEGARPHIPHEWPIELRDILRYGWAHRPSDRPTMKETRQTLERLEQKVKQAAPPPESPKRSKSTSLWDSSICALDRMAQNFSDETQELSKQAGTLFRALETRMIEGSMTPGMVGRGRVLHPADIPHTRHLRSAYL